MAKRTKVIEEDACDPCDANGMEGDRSDEITFRGKTYFLCKKHGDSFEAELIQVFTKPKSEYKSA
ncbi:hypothetical protein [Streptomyces alboflavus]|uniref:hypothetical protein n=1 Tax=Streptomyces alboflavus TaxID=67267 RepID=UPI000F656F87|nr:hypothetical protein [Streptomyces alboflavus]